MAITAGSDILASDFVSTSAGAGDSGKVPKLSSDGKIDRTFLRASFGGNGSDGALSISSGTTNIDCSGAAVVVKNYTSISITGTGKLTFSNPNTNGTIVILKSQGNVTLTSSQTPMIDMSSMGAAGGAAASSGSDNNGSDGSDGYGFGTVTGFGQSGKYNSGTAQTAKETLPYRKLATGYFSKYYWVAPGSGGGGGSHAGDTSKSSGAGGKGGGALVIECAGAWNFTTTSGISVAGANGTNAAAAGGSGYQGQGGGGGGGGCFLALYNTLTSNSGTVTVSGGTAGTSAHNGTGYANAGPVGGGSVNSKSSDGASALTTATAAAQNGATGISIVDKNNDFA